METNQEVKGIKQKSYNFFLYYVKDPLDLDKAGNKKMSKTFLRPRKKNIKFPPSFFCVLLIKFRRKKSDENHLKCHKH